MAASQLSIANAEPRYLPGPQLLHHLVPSEGSSAAIEHTYEDGSTSSLSYEHFHEQTEQLSRRIRWSLGPSKPRHRLIVPLLIPQSLELYISQLAILKAGGAFCPIVWDAPAERLKFILKDVEARILLTTAAVRARLPNLEGVTVLTVDEASTNEASSSLDHFTVQPSDAAYVMYTSGSTGQPKGVVLSHSAACQALLAHDVHIPPFSRFLQFASPTFDVSVFEIFFPWFRGCTLVSCDRRRLLNDLPAAIRNLSIDACELTPSVASSLLRGRESVPDLKVLLTIGEMLKPSVVEAFGGDSSQPAILQGMYGPTESTIHCTLQPNFSRDMSCNSIGIPLDTVSAFVVRVSDEEGSTDEPEILPIGDEGELAVGGYQLADGYLNREDQTKSAFVHHSRYGLLYRTGDRAKMLADGSLQCFGRISSGQVKLRGQRIELGEIEHAASRTPGCQDAVAEVIGTTLVVFCVKNDSSKMTSAQVTAKCREWLPSFMVPGDVVVLESFPHLPSGKCDRKALRATYEERQAHAPDAAVPTEASNELRRVIEGLSHVLEVELTPDSSLATAGLDSITSIKAASELYDRGLPQLDAGHLLTARTPRDIVAAVEASHEVHSQQEAIESVTDSLYSKLSNSLSAQQLTDLETVFPCTSVQLAMLAETSKTSSAYCNWVELSIDSTEDCHQIVQALHTVASSHTLLRAGFVPLATSKQAYVTVLWKSLQSEQIREVTEFDYDFSIEHDDALLRPISIQLRQDGTSIRLLMKLHHALYDQWSIDLLRADLSKALRGERLGMSTSFQKVAEYHMSEHGRAEESSSKEFWQDFLQGVPATILPLLRSDRAPRAMKRLPWRETAFSSANIRKRSQELGCSSPALFQTAFAFVLSCYIGISDVTFGTVFSGRTIPVGSIDSVFGPCLATLPFRMDHRTAYKMRDLLLAVTSTNRRIQHHLMVSPTEVREAAGCAPGTTLFDTLFVWQESTLGSLANPDVHLLDSADQLEFNLTLELEPTATNINIRATYNDQIMDSQQADRIVRQVEGVVAQLLKEPNVEVANFDCAFAPELLSISNPLPATYADTFDLPTAIAARASQSPSALAILFANDMDQGQSQMESITYAELNSRADRMAQLFLTRGLKADGLVCICMEKCIDLYVAMLASFKAGAGYLPLVPETPEGRIRSILGQIDVQLCVCDADTASSLRGMTQANVLDIQNVDLPTAGGVTPAAPHNGSRTAYAVFTSGSTGEPKGVAVTMDNLKGNLAVLAELYQVSPEDRLLQSCSQSFDVSVFEIFFAFYTGMCLCSATKENMFRDIENSIRTFAATHLSMTPTVAGLVDPDNVPTVKFLVTAGEGITERVHRRWAGRGLHQGYGPSETTNICSIKMNVAPDDVLGGIGPPFKNTSAFVIAAEGDFQILPAGSYGEFAFGGEQVFSGYIGRENLNSTKIIDHPDYGRIYRSGDMGRMLSDGTLLIAGRLDDQVKIRGNRVELGEISTAVSGHASVADCTTIVHGCKESEHMLLTFWVPRERQSYDTSPSVNEKGLDLVSELYDRLEGALPPYMIPNLLVPVNELPMTAQGKLDKRTLQALFEDIYGSAKDRMSRSHESSSGNCPSSPTESCVAEIIGQILDLEPEKLSRNASFFALGINSLNAIQVAKGIEKKLQARLSVTAILKHSSVAKLARDIDQSVLLRSTDSATNVRGIFETEFIERTKASLHSKGFEVETVLPCTPLQEAMLSVASGTTAYCNTTKLSFDGDIKKLRECWEQLCQRHSILRTIFIETSNATYPWAQAVLLNNPEPSWPTPEIENSIRASNGNGHANGFTNGSANGKHHGTKLEGVSTLKPVRIEAHGSEVYIQMHHAVYDGISMSNLYSEIFALYNGQHLSPPVPFEPFLAEVMKQNGSEAMTFWKSRFSGFRPHPLPSQSTKGRSEEEVHEQFVELQFADIISFSEKHSCTAAAVLQSAWVKILACMQKVEDVCFGNVISGRSVAVPDVDRLVAPCFNTMPMRIKLGDVHTNLDLIQKLHRTNVDCMQYQLTAPRRIQSVTNDPSRRIFDSLLLVQPPATQTPRDVVEDGDMDMGIPLVLEVTPHDDGLDLQLHYMPAKVPPSLVPDIVEGFIGSLKSCLTYPSSRYGHLLNVDDAKLAGKLEPESSPLTTDAKTGQNTEDYWNGDETLIREIFANLAGVQVAKISKTTSLYQLGLDSLNAVQVASKLRSQDLQVDAADVMQHQTPSAIASAASMVQYRGNEKSTASVDLQSFDKRHRQQLVSSFSAEQDSVEHVWPCTSAQSGMLAQYIQSQGQYYFNHSIYEIPAEIEESSIRQAWTRVSQKHQMLRTGFVQVEDRTSPFAMLVYQESSSFCSQFWLGSEFDQKSIKSTAAKDVYTRLHLPAWRVALYSTDTGRRMCLSMHHALYDAESLALLLADFHRSMNGDDIGQPQSIAESLSAQLDGADSNKDDAQEFWSKTLQPAHLVKFPNLSPTNVKETGAGTKSLESKINTTALDSFCKEQGVTIQALAQSAWAKLLAAYLGEEQVTFGTVFAGPSSQGKDAVAFPSISTLPIHCNVKQSRKDLVQGMVSYNSSAQRHRFTALADIQRHAGTPGQPLFDTVFVYQKSSQDSIETFDWSLNESTLGVDYTVSMEIETAASGKVLLRLTHDLQAVPESHAALMLQQYEGLLTDLLQTSEESSRLDESLVSIIRAKEPTLPCSVDLLHQFVERGAREHPDKPALEFIYSLDEGEVSRKIWTYQDLEDRSNQVAHLLQKNGVKSGGIVAMCMEKSPEATFAFVGILKAGCAFLAMDPELPLARRKFIVEDSSSQVLLVNSGKVDAELDVARNIELTEKLLLDFPTTPVEIQGVDASSTSYCLYTSGTTGTPKGCELTHENAVQAMMSFQRLFADHWTDSSRWLQFASYWFDVSVLEHFWSWSVGITMVAAPRDIILEDLPGFIRAADITHIDLTPSLARLLDPKDVPSLHNHVFITGGESLKQEIIDAWGPLHTIYNGYGPTESTIGCTMNTHIGPHDKPSNIGPPFDNVGVYVFAPDGDEPVLRGAVGELCVSGKLVGKGYLNRPDLTAKAFPYLDRHQERIYRTGDLVRLLANGCVSFIGRRDTQAKLRGQRLEIDEIDTVIKSSSETVADVASLVVKSSEGSGELLVSFIADRDDRDRSVRISKSTSRNRLVSEADQACRNHLPGYMVPTHIVPVSRLPLTVNNKVDAKKLNALFESLTTSELQNLKGDRSESRPLQANEQKVAKVLGKLLGTDLIEISAGTNTFSLGLSSISAINFATQLKRSGFESASVAIIMNNVTLGSLAHKLVEGADSHAEWNAVMQAQLAMSAFEQRNRTTAARSLSIDASEIESIAPCTPLQEGLLVESLKSSDRPYFNSFWYNLVDVNVKEVEEGLSRLLELLPILRTAFIRTDDGFAQVVLSKRSDLVYYLETSPQDRDAEIARCKQIWQGQASQEVSRPYEALLVRSDKCNVLVMHVHHALYDGISWELIIERLKALVRGSDVADSGLSFLKALPYGPLAYRKDAKSFWKNRLDGFHYTPLGTGADKPSPLAIDVRRKLLGRGQLDALQKRSGVSHQAIIQTAFVLALHQLSPGSQTFGVVLSGRSINLENAETIIGPMFNTVPYALDVGPDDSWTELLQRCQKANAAVLPFQHSSLRDIKKHCSLHPADPLFDVLFVFQRQLDATGLHDDGPFKHIPAPTHAEYSLAIEAELIATGDLYVTAAAQRGVTDEASLANFIDTMEQALGYLSQHSDDNISDRFRISRRSNACPKTRSGQTSQLDGIRDFDWTPKASQIRDIIADVAQCDVSSVNEHIAIFTLGLDSIDAVKLAARMKKVGIALPVSKILNAQTIPKMLEAVDSSQAGAGGASQSTALSRLETQLQGLDDPKAMDVERILPAAPGQEALIADMIRSDFHDYFNSDILQLREDVDLDMFESAWQTVVDSTPILRTRFVELGDPKIDAVFAQVVQTPRPVRIKRIKADSIADLNLYIDETRKEVQLSFSQSCPLRLAIATIRNDRYLILSLAHAQYDGHSLALLHSDVAKAYGDDIEPRQSYDDVIELALNATGKESLNFWRNALVGAKASHIPADEGVSDFTTYRIEQVSTVPSTAAKALCQNTGVSLQALAQTSWALLLAQYLQDLEVIFGVVLACRDSEEAEQVMFPTMNTVPLRASLHGNGHEMLRYIQHSINDMRQHQRTPLRAIQAACVPVLQNTTTYGQHGLFDTLFIYQSRGEADKDSPEPLYKSVGENASVEYPIAVEVEAVGEELVLRTACKSSVLDSQGTSELLQRLDQVLQFLVKSPDRPTVEFTGDRASICGLPSFAVRTDSLSRQTTAETQPLEDSEESDDGSWVVETICSALAQVSKVPEQEVLSTTAMNYIGIDSISAIKVASLLRKESLKISVSELIKAQTPKRIASILEDKITAPASQDSTKDTISAAVEEYDKAHLAKLLQTDQDNIEAMRPVTAGQTYMLSLWQKTSGELFYPTFKYRLSGKHDPGELRKAWERLVSRRPILRTALVADGASPQRLTQVILKTSPDSFSNDCKAIKQGQPFARLGVTRTKTGYELGLEIHHALYDAVSLPLLMQDLQSLLNGSQILEPEASFDDYLALSLSKRAAKSRKDFWSQYLAEVRQESIIQFDQPSASNNKVQVYRPSAHASTKDLEHVARSSRISVQSLLFAVYAKIYALHASKQYNALHREPDLVLGIYMSQRSHLHDLNQLREPTLNLLPLLVRSVKSTPLVELARQIDADLTRIGTKENSAASLAEISDWTEGRVKIETFVNFLKLPEAAEASQATHPEPSNDAVIEDTNDAWTKAVSEVKRIERVKLEMPTGLEAFEAHEAYLHAIDVEMSIGKDGQLSIGVFCIEEMLGLREANAMVDGILHELEVVTAT